MKLTKEELSRLPAKETMLKLINAFTPFDMTGKTLDEIVEQYVTSFGVDFLKGAKYI